MYFYYCIILLNKSHTSESLSFGYIFYSETVITIIKSLQLCLNTRETLCLSLNNGRCFLPHPYTRSSHCASLPLMSDRINTARHVLAYLPHIVDLHGDLTSTPRPDWIWGNIQLFTAVRVMRSHQDLCAASGNMEIYTDGGESGQLT